MAPPWSPPQLSTKEAVYLLVCSHPASAKLEKLLQSYPVLPITSSFPPVSLHPAHCLQSQSYRKTYSSLVPQGRESACFQLDHLTSHLLTTQAARGTLEFKLPQAEWGEACPFLAPPRQLQLEWTSETLQPTSLLWQGSHLQPP